MKILSVNAGSSSLKFKLFEMPEEKILISGNFERIGDIQNSFYIIDKKIKVSLNNHIEAVNILKKELLDRKMIECLSDIDAIGHRFTEGGPNYKESVILNDDVEKGLKTILNLAPLHNLANLHGMQAFKKEIPAKQIVVFDNAFHSTIKEENFLYAVPYEWYTKYKVRKYGAHGISCQYITDEMKKILGNHKKLIICHIGNGASISAIKGGKCINTSMGLTPNSGLVMGSRCGDIDATIIPYIMKEANLTTSQIFQILNKESGLYGITGISKDLRDIEKGVNMGNERCILAQKMYVRTIIDYISKYHVELKGADAIIFTGGAGEKSVVTRKLVLDGLKVLGVKIDDKLNNQNENMISKRNSSIPCYVIPTNEELIIVRETYNLIK